MSVNKILIIITLLLAIMLAAVTSLYISGLNEEKDENQFPLNEDIVEQLIENSIFHGVVLEDVAWEKFNRRGRKIESGNKSAAWLNGDKAVLFITSNNCSACRDAEIRFINTLWLEMNKKDYVAIVANFPFYEDSSALNVGNEGFYVVEGGDLGLGIGDGYGAPVLLLVRDGVVKYAFSMNAITNQYGDVFHEFLREQLNP